MFPPHPHPGTTTSARRGNGNAEPDPRRPSPTRWLRSIVASIAANLPPSQAVKGLLPFCQGGGGPNYRACSPSERILPISWDGRNSNWRDAVPIGGTSCRQLEIVSHQLRRPIDGNSFVPIVVVICVGSLQPLLRKTRCLPMESEGPSGWLVALPCEGRAGFQVARPGWAYSSRSAEV